MRKLGKILFCFVPSLATLCLQILVTIPITVIYLARILHTSGTGSIASFFQDIMSVSGNADFTIIVSFVYALANIIIFFFWYRAVLRRQGNFRSTPFPVIKSLIPGIVLCFGLYYLTNYIALILSTLNPAWLETFTALMESAGFDSPIRQNPVISILILTYTVVTGPISEELVFRGVTLSLAKKQMPFFLANILQAALFGLFHLNLLQGSYAFVIGLVFGYVAHNRGTIKATIMLHIIFNLIGMVVSAYLPNYEGSAVYIHMLILAGCIIVTILGLLWYRRRE